MSKRIIISGRLRVLNPLIPFIMSLFVTGMGELYCGSPQRGIILALIRAASLLAIPFYSTINIKNSYLTEIFVSLLFFALITIYSPLNALFISLRKKNIVVSRFISARIIILFAIFNFIITLMSSAVFFSFFSIIKVQENHPPIIEKGDIAIVKKIGNSIYKKGEMVVLNNENSGFVRIIGQPGEDISYSKGRFSVQNSEMMQSIFTEDELKKFSLTDFDVISETNENFKYPVIQNRDQYKTDITLKKDEYFTAPDDRNDVAGFSIVKNENIYGRMEGLLFSIKRSEFLTRPFQITE